MKKILLSLMSVLCSVAMYAGDGTQANPYTVAEVVDYINTLGEATSENEVYVKGKVSEYTTTQSTIDTYGNVTFKMIDEGIDDVVFNAYQVYGLGKKKFTSVDQLKIGDEVIVCGKVLNYNGNTPETVGKGAAYVYSINGQTSWEDSPEGEVIEVTCSEAAELALALDDNTTSEDTYAVTGYITEIVGSVSSGQQTFWMADTKDGGKVFEAYWANLPEGEDQFVAESKVKITGKLMRYGSIPEIKNATVVILEKGGEQPETTTNYYSKVTTIESGAKYLLVAQRNDSTVYAYPLSSSKTYGYLSVGVVNGTVNEIGVDSKYNDEFTLTEADGGYTIQDASERYYYQSGTYNSFSVGTDAYTWTCEPQADGTFKFSMNGYILQWGSSTYKTFALYTEVVSPAVLPYLYKFTGTTPQNIAEVNADAAQKSGKFIQDGCLVIEKNGRKYNVAGQVMK